MKTCEKCKEEKNKDLFYNCSGRKDGKQGYCKECTNRLSKERMSKDKSLANKYYLNRKDDPRYKEQCRNGSEKYRNANREQVNRRVAEWTAKNLDRHSAYQAKRRSVKLNATPSWVNDFFIKEIYALARLRTEKTGIKWHVDHIVPLQSRLVCGLHVECNLAVIPASHNSSKGNKYWENMP
jgi:hypothetical protein